MKPLTLALLLLLVSCGDSPLLNHSKIGDRVVRSLTGETGLHFAKIGVNFELAWQNGCPDMNECSFDLNLETPLPEGASIEAILWMSSMGHGSSPITIQQTGPLHWHFSEVFFIMPGLWELQLKVHNPSGANDQTDLSYYL